MNRMSFALVNAAVIGLTCFGATASETIDTAAADTTVDTTVAETTVDGDTRGIGTTDATTAGNTDGAGTTDEATTGETSEPAAGSVTADMMTSNRPYLIRALYEWIVDNNLTPHLYVDAVDESVEIPQDFVGKNGRIILNISPEATHSLVLGNDAVTFNARFAGIAMDVHVPVSSVIAIYARENGQGMMFAEHVDETLLHPESDESGDRTTAASPDE